MTRRYRKIYVTNPSPRFDVTALRAMADELVYVCDNFLFDDLLDNPPSEAFEGRIAAALIDFSPDHDALVFFGDPVLYAMAILYITEQHQNFTVLRYSPKTEKYNAREISLQDLQAFELIK